MKPKNKKQSWKTWRVLSSNNGIILSLKRLKDNMVFKLNEEIEGDKKGNWKITRFQFVKGYEEIEGKIIPSEKGSMFVMSGGYMMFLDDIKKPKICK